MSYASRRALFPITLAFALASFVSACSPGSQQAGVAGTSGQADSAIGLDMTSGGFTITVENRTVHELVKVEVAINIANSGVPPALRGPYIAKVSRIETGSKRVLSLGEFAARGAAINLNVVRPKEVVVTASDFDGKKYEASLPWKP